MQETRTIIVPELEDLQHWFTKKCFHNRNFRTKTGKLITKYCYKHHCAEHWRNYARSKKTILKRGYDSNLFWYAATLPANLGLNAIKYCKLRTKYLTKLDPQDGMLKFAYFRHLDKLHENYHYVIGSSEPIDTEFAKDYLFKLISHAKGDLKSKRQIYFSDLWTWDGYIHYISGLSLQQKSKLPPWAGLPGIPFRKSENWFCKFQVNN